MSNVTVAPHLFRALEVMSKDMGAEPQALVNQAVFAWLRINGYVVPGTVGAAVAPGAAEPPAPVVPPPAAIAAPPPVAPAPEPVPVAARQAPPEPQEDGEGEVTGPRREPAAVAAAVARMKEIDDDLAKYAKPWPDWTRPVDEGEDDDEGREEEGEEDEQGEEEAAAEQEPDDGEAPAEGRTGEEAQLDLPGEDDDVPPPPPDARTDSRTGVQQELEREELPGEGEEEGAPEEDAEVAAGDEDLPPEDDAEPGEEEEERAAAAGEADEREAQEPDDEEGTAAEEPGGPTGETDVAEPPEEGTLVLKSAPFVLYLEREGEEPVRVDVARFIIGRDPNCSLVINSPRVSREHLAITRSGVRFVIEDLNSSNGTWFGEERVSRREIETGDVILLGNEAVTFVIRAEE